MRGLRRGESCFDLITFFFFFNLHRNLFIRSSINYSIHVSSLLPIRFKCQGDTTLVFLRVTERIIS